MKDIIEQCVNFISENKTFIGSIVIALLKLCLPYLKALCKRLGKFIVESQAVKVFMSRLEVVLGWWYRIAIGYSILFTIYVVLLKCANNEDIRLIVCFAALMISWIAFGIYALRKTAANKSRYQYVCNNEYIYTKP